MFLVGLCRCIIFIGRIKRKAYVFYSRNTGCHGKLPQPSISKILRKYAKAAHEVCGDVPLGSTRTNFRHTAAIELVDSGVDLIYYYVKKSMPELLHFRPRRAFVYITRGRWRGISGR